MNGIVCFCSLLSCKSFSLLDTVFLSEVTVSNHTALGGLFGCIMWGKGKVYKPVEELDLTDKSEEINLRRDVFGTFFIQIISSNATKI